MIETTKQAHVVVIGAGLSGLATARELARRHIAVTVLDAADRVAEPWRARHPHLRLNIHRHFASLPGLEMTRRDGVFVRRDTVINYLERYATNLGVSLRFGVDVTSIAKIESGWHISAANCDYTCSHVVIATGRDRIPHIPELPGLNEYTGELLHSRDIGNVDRFNGKRVLVIGAGNSGTDVLNHLSRHTPAEVSISVRHGPAVVPTRVFGLPLHRLARLFAALPAALLDPAFRLTQRIFLGNLKRYGLNSHVDGGGTRLLRDGIAFAIDDGFVRALKKRWFETIPETIGFDRDRVLLADGSWRAPDVVIFATGYRTGLEPLTGNLGSLDTNGQPVYPMGEADPKNSGLWFTGFRPIFTGYFDAAGIAANRIADGIELDVIAVARSQNNLDVHRSLAHHRRPQSLVSSA